MDLDQQRIRGADAQALLNNPILRDAIKRVEDAIESQALACDPDNKDKAARIIIAKQLLKGIVREVQRIVDDGTVAEVQLTELEKRRKLSVFRR